MKTSAQGLSLLHGREGLRLQAYQDTKGIWTIGYGHTGPEVGPGLTWTREQCEEAFVKDLAWCEKTINLYCVQALNQNQFDALVSFIYNIGQNAFIKSTMLRKLNQGDFEGAAAQFDRWNIPKEIIPRRMGEKAQYLGKAFLARI